MAQFSLLCARWQLSFTLYNWTTTFVLSSLAFPLRRISPAVGWKWLGRLQVDLQERCTANHNYHAMQHHLLGWPVLAVVLKRSAHPVKSVPPSDPRLGVTPSREPQVLHPLPVTSSWWQNTSRKGWRRWWPWAAESSLGQDSRHWPWTDTEEEVNWWGAAGESCPASCGNTPGAVCSTLLSSPWAENTEIWRNLLPEGENCYSNLEELEYLPESEEMVLVEGKENAEALNFP